MNVVVLLCAYNGEKYIRQQLDSIAGQELKPSAIYVYDWGSHDNTVKEVESFRSETSLVCELVQKDKPIGVAAGFKAGMQDILDSRVEFDYLALCDQDDIWLPNKLLEYKRALDSAPLSDLVFSDVSTVDYEGKILLQSRNHSSPYFTTRLERLDESVIFANPVVGMTILASRRLAEEYVTTDLELEIMHDWSLVLICKLRGFESLYIDKPLVLYRQHASNVLGNNSRKSKISLLLHMPSRVRQVINHYDSFCNGLSIDDKFEHFRYFLIIPKLNVLTRKYKFVLLFFIFFDFALSWKNRR
ncbi:glycosyltransferase [Vibrio metschnikovii]|uniref:glycosyltransferase n=1 Tax=Vibrio metschnikovii TaxID=28172 RepID=UPI001C307325|nr:glycosyltransferase [Vibrio metschnikovii]